MNKRRLIRKWRNIVLAGALAVTGLLALEHDGASPRVDPVPAANARPTSTVRTSTTSSSTTLPPHCGDPFGSDKNQNKHCRPPSPQL